MVTAHSQRDLLKRNLLKWVGWVATLAIFGWGKWALAAKACEAEGCLEKTLWEHWKRFVEQPHPMGTPEQRGLARYLETQVQSLGWKVHLQEFEAVIPQRPKGKWPQESQDKVTGINVVAHLKGTQKCHIVMAGHYDTKYFPNVTFVGANDGGSSTVGLLGLAQMLPPWKKSNKFPKDSLIHCSWSLAFLDGEEANFEDWYRGKRQFGAPDHLYGSRYLASQLRAKKGWYSLPFLSHEPIHLVFVIDMIGHKNQSLFLTGESHKGLVPYFLTPPSGAPKSELKVSHWHGMIEDDHKPFLEKGIPVLHLIDWTNLSEWHKPTDNLDAVSVESIMKFLNHFKMFASMDSKKFLDAVTSKAPQ